MSRKYACQAFISVILLRTHSEQPIDGAWGQKNNLCLVEARFQMILSFWYPQKLVQHIFWALLQPTGFILSHPNGKSRFPPTNLPLTVTVRWTPPFNQRYPHLCSEDPASRMHSRSRCTRCKSWVTWARTFECLPASYCKTWSKSTTRQDRLPNVVAREFFESVVPLVHRPRQT